MPDTKIGLNQIDKPAPLWYRRFTNAYILVIMPGVASLFTGWGFSNAITKKILLVVVFSGVLVKGIGIVLGNGQIYSPSNQVIDQQAARN